MKGIVSYIIVDDDTGEIIGRCEGTKQEACDMWDAMAQAKELLPDAEYDNHTWSLYERTWK
jgi:hypothetical protein